MERTVTASGVTAVLRALLPVVLSVGLLVAGLVVTPGSATLAGAEEAAAETRTSTNHTANVTLYDAGDATLDDAGEVEAAIEDGRLSNPGEMAVDETLLVVVESGRLTSAMDERNGSTTDRFSAALDGPADLYLVQTNPGTMVTRTFAVVGAENATAYRNGSTVYALVDTGDLAFRKERTNGTHPVDSLYEDRFAVDFGFDLYDPPWEPPGDPPWGPTFVLSDERFVTPTPEPTPTPTPAPTDSPTPTQTTDPSRTADPSTPTTGVWTDTGNAATPPGTSPSPSANESGTPTTLHRDGPGFTVGAALVALLSLVLSRRRCQ